jgi:cytochrome P450/NADPH-cytochrome P450 reductase
MLFFGCRHPEQDFLYADELKAFAAANVVDVYTAFSRVGENKTYVQHLLAQEKDRVWQLIDQGAVIYVCGDGSKMEPDVKVALMGIYCEKTNANQEMAQQWMEAMSASNRYVLDVWAGG